LDCCGVEHKWIWITVFVVIGMVLILIILLLAKSCIVKRKRKGSYRALESPYVTPQPANNNQT
jgi:hypothetical protein